MTERKLKDDDIVIVAQCDGVRLIGRVPAPEDDALEGNPYVNENGSLKLPIVMGDVGAVLITRGVAPGAIEGTMHQVKQINIATLDYAEAPLEALGVERISMAYTDLMLDEEGRKHMRASYEDFLNREVSVVQHSRTDGKLP